MTDDVKAAERRKPLRERITWTNFPSRTQWFCTLGGVGVILTRRKKGEWTLEALGRGWFIFGSLAVAKAKALRKVRRAIMEAAEAWE